MNYSVTASVQVLERTPVVLKALLEGIDDSWVMNDEGPETFSPYDVIGHLIHGEKTDWVPRAKIILEQGLSKPFEPYDRFAQYEESKGKSVVQLLQEFERVRKQNVQWLQSLNLTNEDLEKKGMHPSLGEVSLKNLLSTWVVHDLTHIAQITRVMAKQYKEEMGPWPSFFRILNF
ncbi:DinB family protein [Lacibacter sp. MH-610]|uniref:DinB family protein n=1 Tax=Lacibacter sp. MH-610 TaxID=3020883 RepID=UPI003891D9B4